MLWAVGCSPRLLVPTDLLAVLSDEQLDTLLLHELAHLRRRDHWVRVLEFVVMGLYWWHPVVWYGRRELREAEEQCCDAWVVSTLPGAGRTYASALLDTLDFLSTAQAAVPPLASGLSHVVDLKRRLTMIMCGNTPRSLSWPGCLAVVALGLTLLPMLPSLHGQAADVPDVEALLNGAKANVELQKAVLELKKADLAKAEADLKAAEVAHNQARLQREVARRSAIQTRRATIEEAERKKKANYRIEITLPDDESVESNVILEKILKVVPEKLRRGIIIRHVPATNNPVGNGPRAVMGLPGTAQEQRIDDLEKKLEKVLQELHDLRKQMKEPRSQLPRLPGRVLPGRVAPPPAPSPVRP
jgi:hypothetical protein